MSPLRKASEPEVPLQEHEGVACLVSSFPADGAGGETLGLCGLLNNNDRTARSRGRRVTIVAMIND